jgi:predicted XRE-type DNA-binding protein
MGDKRDHAIETGGSVWHVLGFAPAKSESLRIRALMMNVLIGEIEKWKLTQKEAARLLGITQHRVSDLTRGKIDLFSIDTLVDFLAAMGLKVDLRMNGQLNGRFQKHSRALRMS